MVEGTWARIRQSMDWSWLYDVHVNFKGETLDRSSLGRAHVTTSPTSSTTKRFEV